MEFAVPSCTSDSCCVSYYSTSEGVDFVNQVLPSLRVTAVQDGLDARAIEDFVPNHLVVVGGQEDGHVVASGHQLSPNADEILPQDFCCDAAERAIHTGTRMHTHTHG